MITSIQLAGASMQETFRSFSFCEGLLYRALVAAPGSDTVPVGKRSVNNSGIFPA